MDVSEIRYRHLLALAAKYENQRLFAAATGLVAPHVSQMLNKKRGIGEGVARRIERKLDLPFGYMDEENPETAVRERRPPVAAASNEPRTRFTELISEMEDALYTDLVSRVESLGLDRERVVPSVRTMVAAGILSVDAMVVRADDEVGIDFINTQGPLPGLRGNIDRIAGQLFRCSLVSRSTKYAVIIIDAEPVSDRLLTSLELLVERHGLYGYAILSDDVGYAKLLEKIFKS